MATVILTPESVFEVVVQPQVTLTAVVGFEGKPGVGGAQISPDPNNALTAKPDGLFVPVSLDLGTFN